jgi:hypothetical protein
MNVALFFFHKRASSVDKEAVNAIKSELPISEDVTVSLSLALFLSFLPWFIVVSDNNEIRNLGIFCIADLLTKTVI